MMLSVMSLYWSELNVIKLPLTDKDFVEVSSGLEILPTCCMSCTVTVACVSPVLLKINVLPVDEKEPP